VTQEFVLVTKEDLVALIGQAVAQAQHSRETAPDNRLLTGAEVAKLLGVSARSISKLVSRDGLPTACRLGRGYRFKRADVDAWVERRADARGAHAMLHASRRDRLRSAR
jgi:excisionase family DNA binding protein